MDEAREWLELWDGFINRANEFIDEGKAFEHFATKGEVGVFTAHAVIRSLLAELEQAEAERATLQADLGRVLIAIETGLTDKPSLEKIKKYIEKRLKETGFIPPAGEDEI